MAELPPALLALVDKLIEHCPDHGCVEPEWEDGCHCEIVPLLRGLTVESNPLCTLCGHLTCQGGKPCGVVSTERGELDQPCPCIGNTPPPLTPCTCRQAIHALEHTGRTVPDCPWCMPTPNIRPNRASARTCNEVELPTHTVDEEA